jgi:hypothetical protein
MARRQAIEPEELFETANRLQAEGKEVTALTLLEALGGGSLRTIYKHLETWQQSRPVQVINTPDEIPPQVQASFAAAWRLAAQEARLEVAQVKEKAKEEVAAALRQFHGALEAIDKLEKEREAEEQAMEALHKLIAEMKAESATAEAEVAAEKARVEELREQLAAQQKDRDALLRDAAESKGQLEALREQNTSLLSKLTADQSAKPKA